MNNSKAPTRRLIIIIYLSIVLFMIIIGLTMGFVIFKAPLLTILFAVLIIASASIIGALIGWFILQKISPQLRAPRG
jgi:hypothetical protein